MSNHCCADVNAALSWGSPPVVSFQRPSPGRLGLVPELWLVRRRLGPFTSSPARTPPSGRVESLQPESVPLGQAERIPAGAVRSTRGSFCRRHSTPQQLEIPSVAACQRVGLRCYCFSWLTSDAH